MSKYTFTFKKGDIFVEFTTTDKFIVARQFPLWVIAADEHKRTHQADEKKNPTGTTTPAAPISRVAEILDSKEKKEPELEEQQQADLELQKKEEQIRLEQEAQAEAEKQRQEQLRLEQEAQAEAEKQRQEQLRLEQEAQAEAEKQRQEQLRLEQEAQAEAEKQRQEQLRLEQEAQAEAERIRQEEFLKDQEAERMVNEAFGEAEIVENEPESIEDAELVSVEELIQETEIEETTAIEAEIVDESNEEVVKLFDKASDLLKTINSLQTPDKEGEKDDSIDFDKILEDKIENPTFEPNKTKDEKFLKIISSKNTQEKLNYLIITAYYLLEFEKMDRFSIKQINAKLMQNISELIDHEVLQSALNLELVELVPDLTGMAEVAEYRLTEKGEEYFVSGF